MDEVYKFEIIMKKMPENIDKFAKNAFSYGGDIQTEWSYQLSGGSILNGTKLQYSKN